MICISYLPWQNTPFRTQRLVTHLPDMEILFFQPFPAVTEEYRPFRIWTGQPMPH